MYFATRTFTMKLGVSVANLLFPSLLLLGRGGADSLGIRLSAVLALIFCDGSNIKQIRDGDSSKNLNTSDDIWLIY